MFEVDKFTESKDLKNINNNYIKIEENLDIKNLDDLKKILKKLPDNYNINEVLGQGAFGFVVGTEDGKAIKISESNQEENYKKIISSIAPIGGGFAKTLKIYGVKINNKNYLIEISKKRLMDLNDILSYKNKTIKKDKKDKIEKDENKKTVIENFSPIAAMIQTASALESAHLNEIVLTDIKTLNIFINNDGVCKLADFGLTEKAEYYKKTKFREKPGTSGYIAENDEYLNEKSDIYSLGVTFCKMFTGKGKISEINIDDIELRSFYPNIDFSKQPGIEREVKEKIFYLLKSMTAENVNDRITIFEVNKKLTELVKYIENNLKNKNDELVDLREDLKLKNKDLYSLGLTDKININEIKEKYKSKLELLINYKNKEEKENNLHLLTILGDEIDKFSDEAIECLNILKNSIKNDGNIKILENFKDLLNKVSNKREKLIISKILLDLEKLKLAEQNNRIEEFKTKSLFLVIDNNPEMIEHLFVLGLDENEIKNLKTKEQWFEKLFEKALQNKDSFALEFLLVNKETKIIIENGIKNENNLNEYFKTFCKSGNIEIINNLLKNYNLNKDVIKEGFVLACENEKLDVVKKLIENKELEIEDIKNGFKIACKNNTGTKIASFLYNKIKNEKEINDFIKETFKGSIGINNNSEIIKFLLDNEFMKEEIDLIEETFKDIIFNNKNIEVFKILLSSNYIQENFISDILYQSINKKINVEFMKLLLEQNCVKTNKELIKKIFNCRYYYNDTDIIEQIIKNPNIEKDDIIEFLNTAINNNASTAIELIYNAVNNKEYNKNIDIDKEMVKKIFSFFCRKSDEFDIINLLLENPIIDKDIINEGFISAFEECKIKMIEFLLTNKKTKKLITKETLNAKVEDFKSKLIFSLFTKDAKISYLLIEAGADFGKEELDENDIKMIVDGIKFILSNDSSKEIIKDNLNKIINFLEGKTNINKIELDKLNNKLSKIRELLNNENNLGSQNQKNNEQELTSLNNSIKEITKIGIEENKNLSNSLKNCNKSESFLDKNQKILSKTD